MYSSVGGGVKGIRWLFFGASWSFPNFNFHWNLLLKNPPLAKTHTGFQLSLPQLCFSGSVLSAANEESRVSQMGGACGFGAGQSKFCLLMLGPWDNRALSELFVVSECSTKILKIIFRDLGKYLMGDGIWEVRIWHAHLLFAWYFFLSLIRLPFTTLYQDLMLSYCFSPGSLTSSEHYQYCLLTLFKVEQCSLDTNLQDNLNHCFATINCLQWVQVLPNRSAAAEPTKVSWVHWQSII